MGIQVSGDQQKQEAREHTQNLSKQNGIKIRSFNICANVMNKPVPLRTEEEMKKKYIIIVLQYF